MYKSWTMYYLWANFPCFDAMLQSEYPIHDFFNYSSLLLGMMVYSLQTKTRDPEILNSSQFQGREQRYDICHVLVFVTEMHILPQGFKYQEIYFVLI